jgi:hypothetical protein
MFLFKLIFWSTRARISLFPKRFSEYIPFSICFQLKEDIFFLWSDDVDDFFFQQFFILFGKFTGFFLGSIAIRNNAKEKEKSQNDINFLHG